MRELPEEIYSVESVRRIDCAAIERGGIPGYVLMARAAAAALRAIQSAFPHALRWQIFCGGGNNAGDGYVLARLAAANGIEVEVVELIPGDELAGDAARAFADFQAGGLHTTRWQGALASPCDLIVDAILGSGLERPVAGRLAGVVDIINQSMAPVVALDIPTGLHGDTGEILGVAVKAELTITFVGLKGGLLLCDGPAVSGDLVFDDLAIPARFRMEQAPCMRRIDRQLPIRALPPRRRAAHKGDFGHVLVVGGGPGMPGAARLCAEAALRTGAGRVSIASHPVHTASLTAGRPELMAHAVEELTELQALIDTADVVAFGPGLGKSAWARRLYAVVAAAQTAAVWDADALQLLAENSASAQKTGRFPRILTPHPGEAASLLQSTPAEIQRDRLVAVSAMQERYGAVTVLKGSGTLIADGSGPPWLCTAGNPGMAAPGMGDVLTGVIAALLAQGIQPGLAAVVGVAVHAEAGDLAAKKGERGMAAMDLVSKLRCVVNR